MTNLPVKFLEWDSIFFNKRIARITTTCLTSSVAKQICDWAINEKIECMYYLASGKEINATQSAEENGFHFIDLRVTFIKDLTRPEKLLAPKYHIRRAVIEDLEVLRPIVRGTFNLTRFRVDPNFDPVRADYMYEVWIENDLKTVGHNVWVVEMDEHIAAYCSVSSTEAGYARIGLVGSSPDYRGKGLSLSLQEYLSFEMRKEGFEFIEVVTQGRNIPAQNLYRRAGYSVRSIDLWYHKWLKL